MRRFHHTLCGMLLSIALAVFSPPLVSAADRCPDIISPGFFDANGTRLIIAGNTCSLAATGELYIIFSDNNVLPVRFLKNQNGKAGNTGRLTAANFDNLPGSVFTVNGQGASGKTCLLVNKSYLDNRQFIPYKPLLEKCDPPAAKQIAAARRRKIENSWGVAQLANGAKIFLVRFKNMNDNYLASLVLLDANNRLVFRDFPAKRHADGSIWRVDDGGKIGPEQFSLLFVAQKNNRLEIAYEFLGCEGSSIVVAEEVNGNFQTITQNFRYMAPL